MATAIASNLEAERALLGAIIVAPKALDDVIPIVGSADAFVLPQHREIWEALRECRRRTSGAVDVLLLADELTSRGMMSRLEGGQQYLLKLATDAPLAENAAHYALIVRAKAVNRRLQLLAADIAVRAGRGDEDPSALVETFASELLALSRMSTLSLTHVRDVTEAVMVELEARAKSDGGLTGLPWGIGKLDKLTGGIKAPQLVVLAARPGLGKSAFAAQIAVGAARKGATALLVNLEMGRMELVERMFSRLALVDSEALRAGRVGSSWEQLWQAKRTLDESALYVEDGVFSFPAICALARRWRTKHAQQRGLLVVDYLQLAELDGKRGASREQVVAEISRGLKKLAKELDVPVVAVSQLNRTSDRENRAPRLSDLRESGAVEQDADIVLFIHREDKGAAFAEGDLDLLLAKHRGGRTASIRGHWVGKHFAMTESALGHENEEERRYADS